MTNTKPRYEPRVVPSLPLPSLEVSYVELTWLPCETCGSLRAWWHRGKQRCMDCDGFPVVDRETVTAAVANVDLTPPKQKLGKK